MTARLDRYLRLSRDERCCRSRRHYYARAAAALAERLGILDRPPHCEWCRSRRWRLERHHFDHSEPLNVLYLCPSCHVLANSMVDFEATA